MKMFCINGWKKINKTNSATNVGRIVKGEMKMNGFINFNKFSFDNEFNKEEKNVFITQDLVLTPLYKKITDIPKDVLKTFPVNNKKIELYCNKCKTKRIFTFAKIGTEYYYIDDDIDFEKMVPMGYLKLVNDNNYFYFIAKADCGHSLIIFFKIIDENTVMKVGQFPSIYDMNEKINNKAFLKELGDEYTLYYKTACSLNSFHSNIGAMTYLRRIFEKLLLDCFEQNKSKLHVTKEDFMKLRMEDKLNELRNFLPKIIFANGYNQVYSKVSNGIHNLSEDECNNLFIPLRMAIEEILIEKLELRERKIRQDNLGKKLQNI